MIELWKHQTEAAIRIHNAEVSALWWEMRTGKTLAAIAGTDDGDRLIVCPNSVKAVWSGDLKKYDQESYTYDRKKIPDERPRNVIVNYESLWRTNLIAYGWDSIIFDESLRLQNPRTKLWAYIEKYIKYVCNARVLLLSGTPCPEGFHQIITQALVATGQYCGKTDPWTALRDYFVYDPEQYKWKIQDGHKPHALKQLQVMGPSMTQAEAGITTKKLYRTIEVPLGDVEEEIWKNVPAKIEEPTLSLYAQSAASGRPIQGTIEQSTKLDAVVEYVIEINHPCVILVRFTESLLYLWRKLQHRIKCAYIYGEDKGAAQRATVIDQFSKGTLQCLICNEATVKVGLNLSAADTLIFAENSWSGEARIQTEERATLKGKGAVEIVDFVSVGEGLLGDIDREILFAVRAKKDFNTKSMRRCHVH